MTFDGVEGILFVCVVVVVVLEGAAVVEEDGKFTAACVFCVLRFLGAILADVRLDMGGNLMGGTRVEDRGANVNCV